MEMLAGCVSFKMDGERSYEEAGMRNQIVAESVDAVVPVVKLYTESMGQRYYLLKLVARGRFTRYSGVRRCRGTPTLAIGFLPGFSASADTLKDDRYFKIPFFAVMLNFSFVGIPTLSSLLFEPFRDYYCSSSGGVLRFTDFGILGFRKYISNNRYDGFAEKSRQSIPEFDLFAYNVEIDGVAYADFDNGNGYAGKVYFTTEKPRGGTVRIKITSAPSTRNDSPDRLTDLVGVEMDAVLP